MPSIPVNARLSPDGIANFLSGFHAAKAQPEVGDYSSPKLLAAVTELDSSADDLVRRGPALATFTGPGDALVSDAVGAEAAASVHDLAPGLVVSISRVRGQVEVVFTSSTPMPYMMASTRQCARLLSQRLGQDVVVRMQCGEPGEAHEIAVRCAAH